MRFTLNLLEHHAVTQALQVAAQSFEKDARANENTSARIAQRFTAQAQEARRLSSAFQEACAIEVVFPSAKEVR